MKKFVIILVILGLIFGGFFGFKYYSHQKEEARIEEIKKGWYVEVLNDFVKIRKDNDRNSAELGEAKKGEVFKASDVAGKGGNYWYHIEYEEEKFGWIANPKNSEYLKDVNNPTDIKNPTIKFFETVYYVNSIDEIKYDHLEVTDDRDGVKVSHKVYHEVDEAAGKDQYWILYTATDAVGKTTSKTQKIEFNVRPDESRVLNFSELQR